MSDDMVVERDLRFLSRREPGCRLYSTIEELTPRIAEIHNPEVVDTLTAIRRQTNRLRALELVWIREAAIAGPAQPDPLRRVGLDEGGVAQVRYALGVSTQRAGREVHLAFTVLETLPALHAAMAQGYLDDAHARVSPPPATSSARRPRAPWSTPCCPSPWT